MIYNIIISPVEIVIDWIFTFIHLAIPQVGIIGAIVGISIAVNLLTLPLYNKADKIQENERKVARSLSKWTSHIRKTFKGDERFMMLSEYYRQNNYHPVYSLRSTVSIMIQIPFFIAAYHYLKSNELLSEASFWIINDLGKPDGLFSFEICGRTIVLNVLPIVMTLVNCISGALYSRNTTRREQIQVYALAAVFLILLYNSPGGLVIYWILNNLFSLMKNLIKMLVSLFKFGEKQKKTAADLLELKSADSKIYFYQLLMSGLGLTLLCGLLIPSNVIATSPAEFSFLGKTDSPLTYIYSSFFIFAGFFIFWPVSFFMMYGKRTRKTLSIVLFTMLICSVFNTFVFKFKYGMLDISFSLSTLKVLKDVNLLFIIFPILISVLSVLMAVFSFRNQLSRKLMNILLSSVCIAVLGIGIMNLSKINEEYCLRLENKKKFGNIALIEEGEDTKYKLSQNGKNVIIFIMDRGVGPFVDDIFQDYPEIREQFGGFTWYPNTVSFSNYTLLGVPPVYGGYEYTPEKINEQIDRVISEKIVESQLVLGKLFSDGGFNVSLINPGPDYILFDKKNHDYDVPNMSISAKNSSLLKLYMKEKRINYYDNPDKICRREIINFSVLQAQFPFTRYVFYSDMKLVNRRHKTVSFEAKDFLYELSELFYMPNCSDFSSDKDSLIILHSKSTHEAKTALDADLERPIKKTELDETAVHYQINAASLKQLGKYFDFLRENNCFDNTRIIIVSDHSFNIELEDTAEFDNKNARWFMPMLLVKDFDSRGEIKIDNTFMTNADTVDIARKGLNLSDKNPYTGKKFASEKDNGINVYSAIDWNWMKYRGKKQFDLDKGQAWHVDKNIYEEKNWIPLIEWEQKNTGK